MGERGGGGGGGGYKVCAARKVGRKCHLMELISSAGTHFFQFFLKFVSKLLLNSILQSEFDLLALYEPVLFHLNPQKQPM